MRRTRTVLSHYLEKMKKTGFKKKKKRESL